MYNVCVIFPELLGENHIDQFTCPVESKFDSMLSPFLIHLCMYLVSFLLGIMRNFRHHDAIFV